MNKQQSLSKDLEIIRNASDVKLKALTMKRYKNKKIKDTGAIICNKTHEMLYVPTKDEELTVDITHILKRIERI